MKRYLWPAILAGFAVPAFGQSPGLGNCPVFPADNIWNTRIDHLPVHPSSTAWINTIGATLPLRPDFGSGFWAGGLFGMPVVLVSGTQTKYPATFLYHDESDPGPYAIPLNAPIEGGSASTGDRHAIAVDTTNCILYELYAAYPQTASWWAGSGAIYNLRSHALRPETWTSADAAGLPIFAGLVRFDEILAGEIRHALRFSASQTQKAYVWPARHYASHQTGAQYPPMGARLRLRADFDISGYSPVNRIILTALKRYGLIIADNGASWFFGGVPDERWDNDELRQMLAVKGSDFETVDATVLMIDPNSGQARQTAVSVVVTPAAVTLDVNRQQAFTAAVTGNSDQRVTWEVNGIVGGNGGTGFIDSITGLYTAPPAPVTVTVRAVSKADPAASGSATVTVVNPAPVVSVNVTPEVATVEVNQQRTFTAVVSGTADQRVTWNVNGITGGAANTGFVDQSGVYTAPGRPLAVTVRAVSLAAPTASGGSIVTVVNPPPEVSVSVSPASATVEVNRQRSFTAVVTGTADQRVTWNVNGIPGGNASVGFINSSTGLYTAPASPVTVTVRAVSTAAPAKSGTSTVTVVNPAPALSIKISPATAFVAVGRTRQFAAIVTNTANIGVRWLVNGLVGGNAVAGTISNTGFYSAPLNPPPGGVVTVTAVSVADPAKSANAAVYVYRNIW